MIILWLFFYENQRKVVVYYSERVKHDFQNKVFFIEVNNRALCQQLSIMFTVNFEIYICNYILCSAC